MDICDIEAVCSVNKTASYSESAFQLSLSHASLSRRISRLEDELGVTLFIRATKVSPVRLTEQGKKLLPYFEQILSCSGSIAELCGASPSDASGVLRVGYGPTIGTFGERRLFSEFALRCPQYTMRRSMYYDNELVTKLAAGELDCIILSVQEPMQERIYHYLSEDKYRWVLINRLIQLHIGLSSSHPLAHERSIRPEHRHLLARETFIVDKATIDKDESLLGKFFGADPLVTRLVDFTEPDTALALVRSGIGVLPQAGLVRNEPGIVYLPVEGWTIPINTHIVCRKNSSSPSLARFIRLALSLKDSEAK